MPRDHEVLDEPYPVSAADVAAFRDNAFVKLRDVLPAETLRYFGAEISRKVQELNTMRVPIAERSTYDRAFLQVMNLWRQSDLVKRFVFSRRLAQIASELLGTNGVRLYHDQALYKEPGGGFTPWHADQYYWPLANERTVTAWIPLQRTPRSMGPLEFSARSHTLAAGRELKISDESEELIASLLDKHDFEHVAEPFELGDISFHAGWLFHRAGPNTTDLPREVMTIIYMDADMRLKAPENENQQADWDAWCPGAVVGSIINTPLNPVLYGVSQAT